MARKRKFTREELSSAIWQYRGDVPAIAREAVQSLRRNWSEPALLNRAREFSYENFRPRLAAAIAV